MSDSVSLKHLCEVVWRRMGVPVSTLFLLYQILLFESISGLPFASISSLPSLKTVETTPNEELASAAYTSNLIHTESLVSASPISDSLPSNNLQLFIGLPIGTTNSLLFQNPSLIEKNSNGLPSPDTLYINLPTTIVSATPVSEPSSSTTDVPPSVTVTSTSTSTSGAPLSKKDFKSDNLKRGSRDTISQEPCFSATQQNLERLTSNCVSNFPSPVFPNMPLLPNIKPMFPSIEKPVDATRPSKFNFVSSLEDSRELSNGIESECTFSSPFQSSILTNVSPNPSSQNNLLYPQDNPNMLLALNLLNKRICQQNSGEIDSVAPTNSCSESSEIITLNSASTPANNAFSSFAEMRNYIDSKQTLQPDSIQNQPNIQNKLSASHISRLNNNLINAKISQSNNIETQILQNNGNCENENQNINLKNEYDNVLRIRNNVIPRMMSNNGFVKSISKNPPKSNNDDNRGCPQVETISVQGNMPFTQNNYITSNCNECEPENNNNLGNTGPISFNNLARIIKSNLNDNHSNDLKTQNNNDQGCPLLASIPVYNKESLLNKQLRENNNVNYEQILQNSGVNINDNNLINQNDQGCPQLLSIAQNNLNARKNYEACTKNQDCNCIQTYTPNDNLAQALKLVNRAKTANAPASTINILPFGEALLDGKPMSNNLIKVESVSCPTQLPTCTCSDSNNPNKYVTIQDVSSMPFLTSPVNSFSCSNPLEASVPIQTNVMRSSPFCPIQTASPIITNVAPSLINLPPSAPIISSITNTELPITNPPLIITQEPSCNSNIQPMFTLLSTPNGMSPIVTPNFIPVQSLPQVTFVNNLPSSMSVTPSLSLPDSCISSISNIPSVYNSLQPAVSSYPLLATNLQQTNSLAASSLFPSLNNMVSSLTQNIIATLMSKTPSSCIPLASLPPVNPFTPNLITETSSVNSPLCLEISEPSNYIVSTPLSSTGLSLSNIPVACNEYLPPVYSSPIIPITKFNTDLFCVESDSAFDCRPFPLSTTDVYYPEVSFLIPPCSTSDYSCLSGPLFMPASSLPQSPSVIKINNTGREAKGFEQLLKSITI